MFSCSYKVWKCTELALARSSLEHGLNGLRNVDSLINVGTREEISPTSMQMIRECAICHCSVQLGRDQEEIGISLARDVLQEPSHISSCTQAAC